MKIISIITIILSVSIGSCSKPEKACFEFSPLKPTTASLITFNASCSENVYKYTWSFGDNSSDSTTTSPSVTHIYQQPGEYEGILNVERKDGVILRKGKTTAIKKVVVY
jgi:PKD repeat protein